jgi:hypothetical protein
MFKTLILQCLHTWAIKNVCFGRDGSDGQACHVPGAPWPSKSSQKDPNGLPFDVTF